MNLNELIKNFVNQREKKEREIGRYYSSELWEILTDRLKPENFFKRKQIGLAGCKAIIEGEGREEILRKIFEFNKIDCEYQVKREIKYKEFVIVAKADFVFKDFILECKNPIRMPNEIRSYHKPQLEAYYQAFGKDIYIGYFKEGFWGKIFKYQPNKKLWNQILLKVKEFHQKLCQNKKKKNLIK